MTAGYLGVAPARELLRGRVSAVSRAVGTTPAALWSYLDGKSVPPPEVALGVADILHLPVELCWTREALVRDYAGRRR